MLQQDFHLIEKLQHFKRERILSGEEKQKICENIASSLHQVGAEIQERQIEYFYRADSAYGEAVRGAIKQF